MTVAVDTALEFLEHEVQLAALRAPFPWARNTAERYRHVDHVAGIVRDHGLAPLGIGSSRFVVGLKDSDLVAKCAWNLPGLAHNLNEAAHWLCHEQQERELVVPCVGITSALVLVQPYAEPLIPRLTSSHQAHANHARRGWFEDLLPSINRLRDELSAPADTLHTVRFDNYGRVNGDLVVLDLDARMAPLEAIAGILRGLENGTVWFGANGEAIPDLAAGKPTEDDATVAALAEAAGFWTRDEDCWCGSGLACGECHGGLSIGSLWAAT